MSSGHGINSKQGRCYPFWNEVARCRDQPNATIEGCRIYVEDYLECLFHTKEKGQLIKMIKALEDESGENQDKKVGVSEKTNEK